jgi:hypothetical protein
MEELSPAILVVIFIYLNFILAPKRGLMLLGPMCPPIGKQK